MQVGGFALIGVVGTGIMMCPQPPVSIPLDIDANSTDEEIVLFLGRRGDGDPIPSNVMTEVNPFSIDPRNSPGEGIILITKLYLIHYLLLVVWDCRNILI